MTANKLLYAEKEKLLTRKNCTDTYCWNMTLQSKVLHFYSSKVTFQSFDWYCFVDRLFPPFLELYDVWMQVQTISRSGDMWLNLINLTNTVVASKNNAVQEWSGNFQSYIFCWACKTELCCKYSPVLSKWTKGWGFLEPHLPSACSPARLMADSLQRLLGNTSPGSMVPSSVAAIASSLA